MRNKSVKRKSGYALPQLVAMAEAWQDYSK